MPKPTVIVTISPLIDVFLDEEDQLWFRNDGVTSINEIMAFRGALTKRNLDHLIRCLEQLRCHAQD